MTQEDLLRGAVRHSDKVQILACRILVWDPARKDKYEAPPKPDKCLVINECVDIEIEDNYKKLINNAVVRLPKGAVVRRTITPEDEDTDDTVYTERMNDGAVLEYRQGGAVATPSDFHVGQRICIRLGYYEETWETCQDLQKRREAIDRALDHVPDFDGYITKCSASAPIEIKCENIASVLKRKTCTAIPPRNNMKVNDLFLPKDDGGKFDLLAGTGLQLYPETRKCNLNVGRIGIPADWTVADLLSSWEQSHLYSFIKYEDGVPYVVIGHTYFSGRIGSSIVEWTGEDADGTLIQFDYDVAQDNLTLMNVDPLFLAVEAQSMTKDGKFYRVAVTLNPKWDRSDPNSAKYRLINETTLSKKSMKLLGVVGSNVRNKVDLSQYTVVPYFSSIMGISREKLIEEAKAYFESYNKNGVEGNLVIFGDHHIRTGRKVRLYDKRNPAKNGWYFVDEVTTKFGVGGFRQTLHLPYCITKPKKENEDNKD